MSSVSSTQGEGATYEEAVIDAITNRRRAGLQADRVVILNHKVRFRWGGDRGPIKIWHTVDTTGTP